MTPAKTAASSSNSVVLRDASLAYGARNVWRELSLKIAPGEFIAVLGPNGSGKTSLLRVLLGLQPLAGGSVEVLGRPPGHGNRAIGYIPQQKAFDPDLPVRGRDLVRFGLDGHRLGLGWGSSAVVNAAIAAVGAESFADHPLGQLSGGEQQRLRVAQALIGDPQLLLCDEPLLSLDLSQQQVVSNLIDARRRAAHTPVIFVTHDINPVLPLVDRVLYLAHGRWVIGAPQTVLTTATLTQLYGAPVEVLRIKGRIIVMGAGETLHTEPGPHPHHHGAHYE